MTAIEETPPIEYTARKLISGLLALPLLFAASTALLIPITIINPAALNHMEVLLPVTIVAELVAIYFGLKIGWPFGKWKEALKLTKPKVSGLLLSAALGIILFFGLQVVATMLANQGHNVESSDTSTTLESLTGFSRIAVYFILSPLVVPIVEEFLFRGWVFNALRESNIPAKFRTASAVLGSALMFAIVHMQGFSTVTDILIPIWIFVIAVIQALLMIKYNSLWMPITLHIFYNGITVLLSVL